MSSEEQQKRNALNDMNRAAQADELLRNPLYIEAISAMQLALQETFVDTKLDQEKERHELWQRMQLLKQFQAKFEHIVKKGAKARETLTLLEKSKQFIGLR